MACRSTVRWSKALQGPRLSVKAPTTRPAVVVRATEGAASTSSVEEIQDTDFKSVVLESDKPVLVEFWATWCGPCKMLDPVLAEVAEELSDQLVCVKMDTDKSPDSASEHGVRSIPTVMIFKGGKRIETVIGAVPKNTLVETVKKCLV